MPQRRYKMQSRQWGRKDRTILEFTVDDSGHQEWPPTEFLSLPGNTSGVALFDVVEALRRAYEAGREDRSAEIPEARASVAEQFTTTEGES